MKRTLSVAAVAVAAVLGLAACSSGAEAPEESVVEETTAAVEETAAEEVADDSADDAEGTDLGTAQACLDLAKPMQEASESMLTLAQDAQSDPQSVVDMYGELANAFDEVSETTSDPELAELAAATAEDGHALTEVMQKVYVDQDYSAMNEYTEASEAFFASYEELLSVCEVEA